MDWKVKNRMQIDQDSKQIGLIDYSTYTMTQKEKSMYILTAAVSMFVLGYIFYHSIVFALIISFASLFYPKIKNKQIIIKRKHELNLQFKDLLYSLSSSISVGKSLELAFKDVEKDLALQYPDPNTDIIVEVQYIIRKLGMNEPIESILENFGLRSQIEDIMNFVDVVKTCRGAGGNLVEIIKNSSTIINDKIEIRQEIDIMLAERKFEQKVLNLIPIGMVLLLSYTSSDYIAPLFETVAGRITMTFAIILFLVAYFISKKIMNINI